MRTSLLRSLPHHPEVMLGMLVVVLGFDCVAGQGSGTRQRHVPLVLRLGIDALIGPPPGGARRGSVRAGRESSGTIALMGHEDGGGFSTVAPCVRTKIRARIRCARTWTSGYGYGLEGGLAWSHHPAPPSRSGLAPAADALTGPFTQKRRLADETRLGLGTVVTLGRWLLVVVVHRTVLFFISQQAHRLNVSRSQDLG